MSIVNVFDPYSGGAIGGGIPGGGPIQNQPIEIKDLSSATFSDPASLLTSYAFVANTHQFTMTTQLANADYTLSSGANFTGPRWSVPLIDSAGVPVLGGDRFVMTIKIEDLDVGLSRGWTAAWGVAKVPSSTVTNTIAPAYIWAGGTGVGTPNAAIGFNNLATTSSLAAATKVAGTMLFGGAPGRLIAGGEFVIQTGAATGNNNRLGVTSWAGTNADPLQLFIAVGSLGAIATTLGTLKMKCTYNIVRL